MDFLDLNINHLRAAMTLLSFLAFGGIVVWAFSKRNKPQFDEAAMLPFLAEPVAKQEATPAATTLANNGDT